VGLIKQRIEAFDPLWAIPVNALFPHVVAAACRARGMRLVHLSTDCVFGGNRGGYREDDTPDAMNLYGRSKLLGEVVGPGAVTLRLSIIGPELRGHLGLLDWILSNRGRVVQGFRDVFFSGLTTLELTHVIDLAIRDRRTRNGLWHVAAQPIDKDSLLRLVDAAFGLGLTIQSVDKGRLDRSLNADRFMDATGWRAPDWPTMVTAMAEDWRARGYPFPPRRQ
jgi:dTDP-4-dehydrorhamnose reductase